MYRNEQEGAARARLWKQIHACREDSVEFVKWVGRKEGDKPIQMTKTHMEWHRALDEHDRVVLFAPIAHGKSNHVTRWRILREMGRNPNIRIGVVSVSKGRTSVPAKFMSAIKADIETSKWLRIIYPHVQRQKSGQTMWSQDGLIIERDINLPDPTLQCFGLYGKILGSRLDLIIIDDVCNLENTMTEHSREKMWEWLSGEVLGRLPPDGTGRVWAVGHVWNKQDVLHRLSRLPGFKTLKYSAFVPDPKTGIEKPLIPEMWDIDELKKREGELGRLAPNMLRNIIPALEDSRIKQSWIDNCLERGRGLAEDGTILRDSRNDQAWGLGKWNPSDSPTFTGVDLSVTGEGDLACLFTITIMPDGTRRLLDIRAGKWKGPKIVSECVDVHRRYGSILMVESNAAQDYLIQFASELVTMPMKKHNTGMNKHDIRFGVESIGNEFEQAKWMIPCTIDGVPPPAIASWLSECTNYCPSEHTGDRLIASWIARENARRSGFSIGAWSYQDDDDFMNRDLHAR